MNDANACSVSPWSLAYAQPQATIDCMQRRIQGYLYGIESEASFKECNVPRSPSPPRKLDPARSAAGAGHQQPRGLPSSRQAPVPRTAGVTFIDAGPRPSQHSAAGRQHSSRWSQGQSLSAFGRGHNSRHSSRSRSRRHAGASNGLHFCTHVVGCSGSWCMACCRLVQDVFCVHGMDDKSMVTVAWIAAMPEPCDISCDQHKPC